MKIGFLQIPSRIIHLTFAVIVLIAAVTFSGIPAQAQTSADYTQGVTSLSSSQARIWFRPTTAAAFVDIHYLINGGGQQNVRMTNNAGTWERVVSGLVSGTRIEYWFTYEKGGPAFDTPHFIYTHGGTSATATRTPTRAAGATATPSSGNGSPFGGTPRAIPGTIQVEDFNTGGQNVAYNDTTAGNSGNAYRTTDNVDIEATTDTGGGYNIGWTATGEWTKYTVNVQTSGTYTIEFRVASTGTAGRIRLEVDGANVTGTLAIPNTGGWQTYTTITRTGVSLSAGQHVLRLYTEAAGANYNWIRFTSGGTVPTNTPVGPSPTRTRTPTPGTSTFWDTSGIPAAQNVLMVKFLNRTNGRWTDSQIFWSFNGVTRSIAQQQFFDMPANSAGRMNFYLESPTSQYTDFIEFTVGPDVFHGNTTRVDWFGIKLAMRLRAHDGYDVQVGEDLQTFQEDRAVTFQKFINEVPAEFDHLAQLWAPYRIPAPGKMGDTRFTPTGQYANYFTSYAQSVGVNANVFDIMACAGSLANNAAMCSALNRHVAHLAQSSWSNVSLFYQAAPANYYAKFWHDHSINKLAYGFPYDDYAEQSSFISHGDPQWLIVAIGW